MDGLSIIKRTATAIPRWPFTINRQSEQAQSLVLWLPISPSLGLIDYAASLPITRSGGTFGAWPDDAQPTINASANCTIQASVDLSSYSAVTITGWFLLRSVVAYNMLVEYGADGASNAGCFAVYTEGNLTVNANSFGGAQSIAMSAGTRLFLTVIFDRTTNQKIYVNGSDLRLSAGTGPGGTFSNQTLNILNRNGGSLQADADLKDFRLYNRALSASEIWALYDPATRYELYQPTSRIYFKGSTPNVTRTSDFNITIGAV